MAPHSQEQEMREQPAAIKAWLRRDLSTRYNDTITQELPLDMLEAIARQLGQD